MVHLMDEQLLFVQRDGSLLFTAVANAGLKPRSRGMRGAATQRSAGRRAAPRREFSCVL